MGDTCHRCLAAADVFIEKPIVLQNGPLILSKGPVIYGLRLLWLKMAPKFGSCELLWDLNG